MLLILAAVCGFFPIPLYHLLDKAHENTDGKNWVIVESALRKPR